MKCRTPCHATECAVTRYIYRILHFNHLKCPGTTEILLACYVLDSPTALLRTLYNFLIKNFSVSARSRFYVGSYWQPYQRVQWKLHVSKLSVNAQERSQTIVKYEHAWKKTNQISPMWSRGALHC